MRQRKNILFFGFLFFIIVINFQNCSQTGFTPDQLGVSSLSQDELISDNNTNSDTNDNESDQQAETPVPNTPYVPPVFDPVNTIYYNALGDSLNSKPPFAFSNTKVVNNPFTNRKSYVMRREAAILDDGGGWGQWGGTFPFPRKLRAGENVHIRVALFIPNNFDWTAMPHLKFLRVHTGRENSAITNVGYNDLYISNVNDDTGVSGQLKSIYEGGEYSPYWTYAHSQTGLLKKGEVNIVEMKVILDETPYNSRSASDRAKGLGGRITIWLQNSGTNNKLVRIIDAKHSNTLESNTTNYADSFFLFTYWNGEGSYLENGLPKVPQTLYVESIAVVFNESGLTQTEGDLKIIGTYLD